MKSQSFMPQSMNTGQMSARLLLLLPLLLSVCSVELSLVDRSCTADWELVSSQSNLHGAATVQVSVVYAVGRRHTLPAASAARAPRDGDGPLVRLTVRLHPALDHVNGAAEPLDAQLSGPELTSPAVTHALTVAVPARASVTVWQLAATLNNGGGRFGLGYTAVTSGTRRPGSRVASCSATSRPRRLLTGSDWVRLRHAKTGKYLVMRPKRGWEAASLGETRRFRYRLPGLGLHGGAVRIEAETQTYGGFKFAYPSAITGRVYFDQLNAESEAQQWTLSEPYPRDGDLVTVRSLQWPSAALVRSSKQGSASVYCLYSSFPDAWILELD